MGQVIPIIEQSIPSVKCIQSQTFWKDNYSNFTCDYPHNSTLAKNYLQCISKLILLNITLFDIAKECPGVNINPVSEALASCKWCYPKYDCFQVGGPYISLSHPISLPPEPEPCIDLKLQLYTNYNKFIPTDFRADDDIRKVSSSKFNSNLSSIFIIGGLQNGNFKPYDRLFIEGFLNCKSYNVFIVNWAKGSGALYEQAIANARLVGAMLAHFITQLKEKLNYSPSKCHLIGHSTGGIIASEAGKRIPGLGRITGLDSAGIYFQGADIEICLDPTDATFVDVIHSNAPVGTFDKAGHLDFWPNCGTIQTGCDPIRRLENGIIYDILLCSHVKSIYYFYYSLPCAPVNCNFTAHMCSDCFNYGLKKCNNCGDGSKCANMGYSSIEYKLSNYPLPAEDSFYLTTAPDAPFCLD